MTRIYVDCTATAYVGIHTGIQRVVRNIVSRQSEEIIPVISVLGMFWRVGRFNEGKRINTAVVYSAQSWRAKLSGWPLRAARLVWRLFFKWAWSLSILIAHRATPVWIGRQDTLLLADSWWGFGVLNSAQRVKGKKVGVMFDLVPLTHPQHVEASTLEAFRASFGPFLDICDGFVAISKTVQEQMRAYTTKPVDYFYLGADIPPTSRPTKTKSKTFLMVGTIEPRKGYRQVLDAFERLWSDGFDGRLVIVGREGWMCDDIMTRIETSPYRGSRLFAFHDADDHELSRCYDEAGAIILASEVEGFGLPLVEAMQKGKPVLAHDIPVFREIGGDYPVYFTYRTLADKVRAFDHKPAKREWLTWDESVGMLVAKVAA